MGPASEKYEASRDLKQHFGENDATRKSSSPGLPGKSYCTYEFEENANDHYPCRSQD